MLAIIPARGGSKGLPGKNIKPLMGKPLIAYTIEAALAAKSVTAVHVSTDDEEIAKVSIEHGASVPFLRPKELATDESPAIDTYLHHIERCEKESGQALDQVVILLPTCPLRTSEDIDAAAEIFRREAGDSVISYTQEHHPISWHKYLDDSLRFENIWNDDAANMKNRQALRVSYYPNGALYIFRVSLLRQRKYYSENSFAYVMPRERSVDIDTADDFKIAEFYLRNAT